MHLRKHGHQILLQTQLLGMQYPSTQRTFLGGRRVDINVLIARVKGVGDESVHLVLGKRRLGLLAQNAFISL